MISLQFVQALTHIDSVAENEAARVPICTGIGELFDAVMGVVWGVEQVV